MVVVGYMGYSSLIAGPKVHVVNENAIVNFGNMECGKISHGSIRITNQSDISATFQVCMQFITSTTKK